ncbi:uncharacterized protein C18orf63-like isoform X3 [Betta splendens]|uniref:Uncharacterized protein C18orf63-like isoform X3 n=1 Tax=Betta splendens TaxID=158456 RepID=A0A9W2XS38_BETSP|nr:uncharacterized protein C18orf63-like isoform X3 [Betta splendens]
MSVLCLTVTMMSGAVQPSLFFLSLPDLSKMVSVTLSLQQEDEESRSSQLKTCRELVLLYSDILASPALDCFTDITVVMAKGIVQVFAQRHSLQLGSPQCVLSGVFQSCLSYSLVTRLAPRWNKAGPYLISGKNFVTDRGRMNAVNMELSTREGQLCFCIEASSVRLPPTTLEDFHLAPPVLRSFCSDPLSILDPSSTGGTIWCHVLPSMKKGQIITINRQLPRDGPFRTYKELQNHWNSLYGYRLPDLAEEEVVYCSIYFKLVGDRLFTYPLSCIRLQPVQRCPQVDLQQTLGSFLSDVKVQLPSVCGFPAHLTSKPFYHTVALNTAATVRDLSGEQVNLTPSSSIRLVLTQPPAPPPPPPVFAWSSMSQPHPAQGRRQRTLSSPSSTSHAVHSSGYQSASSLTSSTFSSSVCSPCPFPTQTWISPASKVVPIFKNKFQSHHVNIALLRVQKQRQNEGMDRKGRVTIPTVGKNKPTASSASFTVLPPPTIFSFKPQRSTGPHPSADSKPEPVLSLSPESKCNFSSQLQIKSKNKEKTSQRPAAQHEVPHLPCSSNVPSEGVLCESKVKKSRAVVRGVDVEQMARSHQLSEVNSATLLAWLKERGVLVSAKHKKEELMLKAYQFYRKKDFLQPRCFLSKGTASGAAALNSLN